MFPEIKKIDDVYKLAVEHEDFTVDMKHSYLIVKYTRSDSKTFEGEDAGLLRECRGLIFDYPSGDILSRPFHKFFNVGEKEETFPKNLDFTKPHVIQAKMDGSMVRPFRMKGSFVFATKSGVTDIAMSAQDDFFERIEPVYDYQAEKGPKHAWMEEQIDAGRTPIFEYISPENRIVVRYGKPDLVFLALRDNVTGEYIEPETPYPGSRVATYGSVDDVDEFVADTRALQGEEGYVVAFEDGFRVKVKSEWYVQLHTLKDNVNKDRYIAQQVLDETLDDSTSMLDEEEREIVSKKASDFMYRYHTKLGNILYILEMLREFLHARSSKRNVRKAVALEFVPTLKSQTDARYVYAVLDGKDVRALFDKHVRTSLTSDTKFAELIAWMNELS